MTSSTADRIAEAVAGSAWATKAEIDRAWEIATQIAIDEADDATEEELFWLGVQARI